MYSQLTRARIQKVKQLSGEHQDRRRIQVPVAGVDGSNRGVEYTDQLTFYHGRLEQMETLGVPELPDDQQ